MKVYKFTIKFEQDGIWSEREADIDGFLIRENDKDDIVKGYVKILYPTQYDSVRYIIGLLRGDGALAFMQMSNDSALSTICYVFPDTKKNEGYWSDFKKHGGFFPVWPGSACSQGHATLCMEEVTGECISKIGEEISKIFEEKSSNVTSGHKSLMQDVNSLEDFLSAGMYFQMKLHCGKW